MKSTYILILVRNHIACDCVLGTLYLHSNNNDIFLCATLEPCTSAAHPCVPQGTYSIDFRFSPKFSVLPFYSELGGLMPHINVPNRSNILIHCGNYPKDTLGCILVGSAYIAGKDNPTSLVKSKDIFPRIYHVIKDFNVTRIIVK